MPLSHSSAENAQRNAMQGISYNALAISVYLPEDAHAVYVDVWVLPTPLPPASQLTLPPLPIPPPTLIRPTAPTRRPLRPRPRRHPTVKLRKTGQHPPPLPLGIPASQQAAPPLHPKQTHHPLHQHRTRHTYQHNRLPSPLLPHCHP